MGITSKHFIYYLQDPDVETKGYIGRAVNPLQRYWNHLCETDFKKFKPTLKRSWIKSLKNKNKKPILIIIDEVPCKEVVFWEEHYISLYKSWGFNLKNSILSGKGTFGPQTKEWKENRSKAMMGHKVSDETRMKISKKLLGRLCPNKGKSMSSEQKNKISETLKGHSMSQKTKDKISKTLKDKRNKNKSHS